MASVSDPMKEDQVRRNSMDSKNIEFNLHMEEKNDQPYIKSRKATFVIKRAIDILGALAFFLAFGWLFLIIWLVVLKTTGRPAIYKHQRIGKNGKPFACLKFRSMVVNADAVLADLLKRDPLARAEWEKSFKLKNDPRITKFGRFLRKSSLDELPQFWNVLIGDMSLVGPRPVVLKELEKYYGKTRFLYQSVRPGVTGPWQIGGRSDLNYEERVMLDAKYVTNISITGDLKIIFKTVTVLFLHKGSY